jgi:hypothetical protein
MESSGMKPIEKNFKDKRTDRQSDNNKIVYDSIMTNNMKIFYENINEKEFERTLKDLEIIEEEFIIKCKKDPDFCKVSCRLISKNASRQGTKDESEQIKTCNITAQKCGINITQLSQKELRPTKDGSIVSKDEMKSKKIEKDDCYKTFDASISGKMNGFITAKVTLGSGGHQDNVLEELDTMAKWWKTHKCKIEEILIVLFDTDSMDHFNRLKEKYNDVDNIMVFNHVEFQQYMIDTYESI